MTDKWDARIQGYMWAIRHTGEDNDWERSEAYHAWRDGLGLELSASDDLDYWIQFFNGVDDFDPYAGRESEYYTVAEAAAEKSISEIAIRRILGDAVRRESIFPRAYQEAGRGSPRWRIHQEDLAKWTPIYGRGKKK